MCGDVCAYIPAPMSIFIFMHLMTNIYIYIAVLFMFAIAPALVFTVAHMLSLVFGGDLDLRQHLLWINVVGYTVVVCQCGFDPSLLQLCRQVRMARGAKIRETTIRACCRCVVMGRAVHGEAGIAKG